jgi:malate dehydrogenase (oxaloacetate-decarboxylating)(NADP+)
MPVINPYNDEYESQRKRFGELFFEKRQRRGFNKYEAYKIMRDRNYFGCMMVETGEADAMISGLTKNYPDIDPAGPAGDRHRGWRQKDRRHVSAADEKGAVIPGRYDSQFQSNGGGAGGYHPAGCAGSPAFQSDPRVAMLSYSNFGTSDSPEARLVAEARAIS